MRVRKPGYAYDDDADTPPSLGSSQASSLKTTVASSAPRNANEFRSNTVYGPSDRPWTMSVGQAQLPTVTVPNSSMYPTSINVSLTVRSLMVRIGTVDSSVVHRNSNLFRRTIPRRTIPGSPPTSSVAALTLMATFASAPFPTAVFSVVGLLESTKTSSMLVMQLSFMSTNLRVPESQYVAS